MCRCRLQQRGKCRRYFPSQTAILRRGSAQSQEKEKETGGFCSAEMSEMGTIPVFRTNSEHFKKEDFICSANLGDEKNHHTSKRWLRIFVFHSLLLTD